MLKLNTLEMFRKTLEDQEMVLAYFTSTNCNMCKDLFPKVESLVNHYPNLIGIRVEVDLATEFVGAYGILTVPTMVLFVQGKETIRQSRQVNLGQLENTIDRYHQMIFEH